MHDNLKSGAIELPQTVTEQVSGYTLNDVLCEFASERLNPLPALCRADAFVGEAVRTEAANIYPRLDIGEASALGQRDEQHSAPMRELYAMRAR
jgi:hypothetical protein